MAFKEKKKADNPEAQVVKAWLDGLPDGHRQMASEILSTASEKGYSQKSKQGLMDGISSILKKCQKEPVLADYLLEQTRRNAKLLPADSDLTGYYEKNAYKYLWAVSSIRENESFGTSQLTKEFFFSLFQTVGTIIDNDATNTASPTFNAILTRPDLSAEMFGLMEYAIRKAGNSDIVLQTFSEALKPGAIYFFIKDKREWTPETVREKVALVDYVARHSGSQTAMALYCLRGLLQDYSPGLGMLIRHICKTEQEPAKAVLALEAATFRQRYHSIPNEKMEDHYLALATLYADGKKLAKSLGAEYNNAEICLNFAYALSTIGTEKTRELYGKTGIVYFMRYDKETLGSLHSSLNGKNQEKPLLLAVFNKNDPNGAFYVEGVRLEKLTKYYRVIIVEAENEGEFYGKIASVADKYGKIDTLAIGGHGTPDSIRMGKDTDEGRIDLTDRNELKALGTVFARDPTVILISCSTGRNSGAVGAMLSETWKARLFAPEMDSSYTDYILNPDGKIERVSYSDAGTSEFRLGLVYSRGGSRP